MALNKADLTQIKEVVHAEMESAVDNFAILVNKGFEQTVSKVELKEFRDEVREGFRAVNVRLDHQDAELSSQSADLQEIKANDIPQVEFEDLGSRVKYVELKLGIESRK